MVLCIIFLEARILIGEQLLQHANYKDLVDAQNSVVSPDQLATRPHKQDKNNMEHCLMKGASSNDNAITLSNRSIATVIIGYSTYLHDFAIQLGRV